MHFGPTKCQHHALWPLPQSESMTSVVSPQSGVKQLHRGEVFEDAFDDGFEDILNFFRKNNIDNYTLVHIIDYLCTLLRYSAH